MQTIHELIDQMRDGAREVLSLAFFYFAAIAAERLFIARVAAFVGEGTLSVLPFAAAIVLAAIVGFLLRPYLVYRFADDHSRRVTSDVMGTLAVAAPVVVIMAQQFAAMLAGGLVAACALGYAGSAAHAGMARKFGRGAGLPHAVSIAYATGVAMQLINNVVVPGVVPSQFIFMVVDIAMIAMLHEQGDRWAATRRARAAAGIEPDAGRHAGDTDRVLAGHFVLATACLAGMFGLLDGMLVARDAPGLLGLDAGARALLVVSVLAAGALCGVKARALYTVAPGLAGALAMVGLALLAAGSGAEPPIALLCAGSGFLVVFFTATFMRLAPRMHMVELWPVMGCAVAYGAGTVGVLAGALLVGVAGAPAVVAVGVTLFAGAVVALRGCAGPEAHGPRADAKTDDGLGASVGDARRSGDTEPETFAAVGKGAVAAARDDATADDGVAVDVRLDTATSAREGRGAALSSAMGDGAVSTAVSGDTCDSCRSDAAMSGDTHDRRPSDAAVSRTDGGDGEPRSVLTERVARFGEANGFTSRECEILAELLVSDDSMREVAGRLYLSRSTLYRHISTMNKKTGSTSRAGLIKAFWLWDNRHL